MNEKNVYGCQGIHLILMMCLNKFSGSFIVKLKRLKFENKMDFIHCQSELELSYWNECCGSLCSIWWKIRRLHSNFNLLITSVQV